MPKKTKLRPVTSGLAFDEITSAEGQIGSSTTAAKGSFVTSHTARVYLAGAGFLADAYDLFVINLVLRLLRDQYPHYTVTGQLQAMEGMVASSALFGSIFGQVIAGNLADVIGRKKIFVATAVLITLGSFFSASTMDSPSLSIYAQISFCRFFLGLGVGGEYPLAATVTSESSSAKSRGSLMCAVFAMQGVGSFLSVMVVLICLYVGMSAEFTWRFSLAFGALPVVIAFPWRLFMHETETFERVQQNRKDCSEFSKYGSVNSLHSLDEMEEVGGDVNKVAPTYSRLAEMKQALSLYKWHMLGTAGCWYLLDVDFYANGLFNHEVTALILSNGKKTSAIQDALNSLVICVIGIPGYVLSVYFIDAVGRKNMQFRGFLCMSALFAICGYGHDWFLDPTAQSDYRKWIFMFLYALTFLFSNFGPNTTTFVIPGEIYPPEVKASCHGLSAAAGKLGAASGALFFPLLMSVGSDRSLAGPTNSTAAGMKLSMYACSVIAILGATLTYYFIPEYSQRELEDVDCIFPLEHSCLKPSPEQLGTMREAKKAQAAPYTMFEIIASSDNYCIGDYFDKDDGEDGEDDEEGDSSGAEDGEESKSIVSSMKHK